MSREHTVYRFFDRAGELLYVGMTCNFPVRQAHHRAHQPWWSQVDPRRTRVALFHSREAARTAEVTAIRSESPRENILIGGPLDADDEAALLAAFDAATATAASYRAVVVEMMHKSSVREVARLTGLSTNTLQRWKREASDVT